MDYCRNILRLKEILGKKLRATGRDLLSKEEISYDRKKFPVTGRNVLSQEEISSDRSGSPPPFPKCAYVILETKMSKITHN